MNNALRVRGESLAETLSDRRQPRPTVRERFPPSLLTKYEPLGILGVGGMGTVFEVCHRGLGRAYALKLLNRWHRGDGQLVRRFAWEAKLTARLDHPNLPRAFDFETTVEKFPYLTMDVIEGRPLTGLLSLDHERLPMPARIEILRQLVDAVAYLHARGIAHLDIAPQNVLVRSVAGRLGVCLIDLGLATSDRCDDAFQCGRWAGTLQYASPEQLRGKIATVGEAIRSDVYSLAVLSHQLLTGDRYFPVARNAAEALAFRRSTSGGRLSRIRQELPRGLAAAVRRALSQSSQQRPGSALELQALAFKAASKEGSFSLLPRPFLSGWWLRARTGKVA